MTAGQRAAFSAWMDRIYDGFVGRVAEGRRLSEDRVRQIAKGRVWTGAQAKSLGLVDRLGGFYDAIDRAQALAGIKGAPRLEFFNTETSPIEALRRVVGASAQGAGILARAVDLADAPASRALVGELDDARLRAQGATVLMPGLVR
jgi:protease-4